MKKEERKGTVNFNNDSLATKRLKLIFTNMVAFYLIFMFALLFASYSFGWFSVNTEGSAVEMYVIAKAEDIECEFSLYAYDLSKQEATEYKLIKGSDGEDVIVPYLLNNFDFNTHDAIFEELNQYTTVLLQMDITGPQIINEAEGTIRFTFFKHIESGESLTSDELNGKISNILDFRIGISEEIRSLTTVDAKWQKMKTLIKDTSDTTFSSPITMVTKSGSTYTTVETIYLDCHYVNSDRYDKDGKPTVTIFLVMDYNAVLTATILQQSGFEIGEVDFSVASIIPIENDLEKLIITVPKDDE